MVWISDLESLRHLLREGTCVHVRDATDDRAMTYVGRRAPGDRSRRT